MNILLVDDESYVTESLYQTIPWRELDIEEVYQASSALEAIDLLEEEDIDVVVTDVRMPVMTGLELMETITERWTHIRAFYLRVIRILNMPSRRFGRRHPITF